MKFQNTKFAQIQDGHNTFLLFKTCIFDFFYIFFLRLFKFG
jgi:hypothetical protein